MVDYRALDGACSSYYQARDRLFPLAHQPSDGGTKTCFPDSLFPLEFVPQLRALLESQDNLVQGALVQQGVKKRRLSRACLVGGRERAEGVMMTNLFHQIACYSKYAFLFAGTTITTAELDVGNVDGAPRDVTMMSTGSTGGLPSSLEGTLQPGMYGDIFRKKSFKNVTSRCVC